MNNFMNNRTILSICDVEKPTNQPLFRTDSYPAIPNVGEEIFVGVGSELETCKVVRREISYTTDPNGCKLTFILIWVNVL